MGENAVDLVLSYSPNRSAVEFKLYKVYSRVLEELKWVSICLNRTIALLAPVNSESGIVLFTLTFLEAHLK